VGKIEYFTGRDRISVSVFDKVVFVVLVIIAIQSSLYFADYWFFGDHRKNIILFIILSYVVFRNMFRSIISWFFFMFISIPVNRKHSSGYTVDVLTTAMPGEPFDMFKRTLTAIAAIKYPHNTYLLDGGNDPALRALCEELTISHVNCQGITGAKGGKINYCLQNYAKSDLVMIIDPDHIPQTDFLDRVVDCFDDEKVGFVQVVQPYYNRNESDIAYGAAEQGFGFYGPLQMGLDGLGMSIAIGANCTFRRKALDSIKGHAIHLAEDACTSLRLHAEGWMSRYVPYRASYGIVPADIQTFFKQQIKWAAGMFELFTGELPKVFSKLNFHQKIYYSFAGTYYLNGIATLLSILLPILFLFLQIYAIEMPLSEYLIHLTPYVISSLAITFYLQKWYSSREERGFPWRSLMLEKGSWFIFTMAFFSLFTRKKITYIPTPKTKSTSVNPWIYLPSSIAVILSASAILFSLTTYHRIDHGTMLMIFFASLNIITLIPSIIWSFNPSLFKNNSVYPDDEILPDKYSELTQEKLHV
jgi:cellulose synthase (UDP-forming)